MTAGSMRSVLIMMMAILIQTGHEGAKKNKKEQKGVLLRSKTKRQFFFRFQKLSPKKTETIILSRGENLEICGFFVTARMTHLLQPCAVAPLAWPLRVPLLPPVPLSLWVCGHPHSGRWRSSDNQHSTGDLYRNR